MQFDIVIPLGPNDIEVVNNMVTHLKQNVIGYRKIYIISYKPDILINDCIIVDENIFPFNIKSLGEYTNNSSRTGWYLQQLLKLYAGFHVPGILETYLVIDADTFFINPTTFFDENGIPLYNVGTEYHIQYFEHMKKLHPTLIKQNNYSGICHHMIFNRVLVQQLLDMVEDHTGDVFWKCFVKYLDPVFVESAGASEYEIYFNYLLIYHSNKMKIRELKWMDVHQIFYHPELNYISWHHYKR